MIILFTRTGQMCNQLISLAAIFSLGIEYKCVVKCPLMDRKLKNYFNFDSEKLYSKYIMMEEMRGSVFFIKIVKGIKKISPGFLSGGYNPQKKGMKIFCDWLSFLDLDIFRKHLPEIREYFYFKTEIVNKCLKKIKNAKRENSRLVGVHIRRGDYKEYLNGRWYYSDLEYIKWMKKLKSKCDNVVFFIASNESIDEELYNSNGLNIIHFDNTAVEDVCMLSLCDYIMGPPSTFSMWASILGNNPRCVLTDRDYTIKWEDFLTMDMRIKNGLTFQ